MKASRRGVHADFLSLPFRIEQRLVGLRDLLLLHYFGIETQDKRSHRVGGPVTLSIDEILIYHFRLGGAICAISFASIIGTNNSPPPPTTSHSCFPARASRRILLVSGATP